VDGRTRLGGRLHPGERRGDDGLGLGDRIAGNVSFSGSVTINSNRVSDPDFGTPDAVVLSIDLSGMKGTGSSTKATYVVSNQEVIIRRLKMGDNIVVTFPFNKNGANMSMSPRLGAASLALSFDVTTGALTGAKVTVSNP